MNRDARRASNKEARRAEAEEDRDLIEAAQRGDRDAFRRLVERHQRRAFVVALALVRDESDAREIVQEAFLRVYKSLPTFQGGSAFFTWLYRIVTNLAIDLIRKPGRQQPGETDDGQGFGGDLESETFSVVGGGLNGDPLEAMHRNEIAARLRIALDALPPYHRSVILMRELEGMSYEEMAEAMGVSKGTIMSRLFHARQKLQRALVDLYRESGGAAAKKPDREEDA